MAKERDISSFDGFDGAEVVYDDRKEKQYQSRIWVLLLLIAGLMLLSFVFKLGEELVYKIRGTAIEAEYNETTAKNYARYCDENGKWYTYDMADFFAPKAEGDKIVLYYISDLEDARPMSAASAWLYCFGFFGVIFGISVWRLYRIWHPRMVHGLHEGDRQLN